MPARHLSSQERYDDLIPQVDGASTVRRISRSVAHAELCQADCDALLDAMKGRVVHPFLCAYCHVDHVEDLRGRLTEVVPHWIMRKHIPVLIRRVQEPPSEWVRQQDCGHRGEVRRVDVVLLQAVD